MTRPAPTESITEVNTPPRFIATKTWPIQLSAVFMTIRAFSGGKSVLVTGMVRA